VVLTRLFRTLRNREHTGSEFVSGSMAQGAFDCRKTSESQTRLRFEINRLRFGVNSRAVERVVTSC
jgi:hypothetical protein